MKRLIITFSILFVLIGQTTGYAADGNKLLFQCKTALKDQLTGTEFQDSSFCMGFLNGMTGTVSVMASYLKATRPFCSPDGMTTGQGVRVVVKYLENHPELLHSEAAALAMLAFMDAFPCKQ